MAEIKIAADSGGGSVSIKGPSTTGSNAAREFTLPDTYSGNGEIVTKDSSDNVLIGTTDTSLYNNSSGEGIMLRSGSVIDIARSGDLTLTLNRQSSDGGIIGLYRDGTHKAQIGVVSDGITFYTSGTSEKMRITSTGFIKAKGDYSGYISDSDSSHEFNGDTSGYTTMKVRAGSSNGNGIQTLVNSDDTGNYFFAGRSMSADSARMYIWSNGDLDNNNNSYGALSDVKLKENIVDASSQWNDIKNLKVRKFNFKDNASKPMIGLIAQEAETVSPGLVDSHPDTDAAGADLGTTTKSVKYSVLYMKAIKALQEAIAKIETLETKVAALEAG